MKYPFEASYRDILADPDAFVTAVFSSLASELLVLPKGNGFIEYQQFEVDCAALGEVTADHFGSASHRGQRVGRSASERYNASR
jgi:hypothetical protein